MRRQSLPVLSLGPSLCSLFSLITAISFFLIFLLGNSAGVGFEFFLIPFFYIPLQTDPAYYLFFLLFRRHHHILLDGSWDLTFVIYFMYLGDGIMYLRTCSCILCHIPGTKRKQRAELSIRLNRVWCFDFRLLCNVYKNYTTPLKNNIPRCDQMIS